MDTLILYSEIALNQEGHFFRDSKKSINIKTVRSPLLSLIKNLFYDRKDYMILLYLYYFITGKIKGTMRIETKSFHCVTNRIWNVIIVGSLNDGDYLSNKRDKGLIFIFEVINLRD